MKFRMVNSRNLVKSLEIEEILIRRKSNEFRSPPEFQESFGIPQETLGIPLDFRNCPFFQELGTPTAFIADGCDGLSILVTVTNSWITCITLKDGSWRRPRTFRQRMPSRCATNSVALSQELLQPLSALTNRSISHYSDHVLSQQTC